MYEHWNEKFIQAKSSLRDREKKLDEVYPMFGCTLFYFWSFYVWNFFFGQMKMMLLTLFLIIFYSSFQMNYYLTNINNHEIWLQILHCLIVFYIYEYLMFWSWNKNFKAKRRYLEEDKRVPIYSSISPDQYLLLQWIDLEAFLAAHWLFYPDQWLNFNWSEWETLRSGSLVYSDFHLSLSCFKLLKSLYNYDPKIY